MRRETLTCVSNTMNGLKPLESPIVTPSARGPRSPALRVKFILPSLIEAGSPFFRPIKYSLFPPLGLATLAAYLGDGDEAVIEDEHVKPVRLDDDPELVVIQVYITWKNIWNGAATKPGIAGAARHFTYATAWKKCEPLWRLLIGAGQVARALPALESVLAGFQRKSKPAHLAIHDILPLRETTTGQ